MYFKKVAIIGVGLIGASFALAIKNHGLSNHITGYGRNEEGLKDATNLSIIDSYSIDLDDVCDEADLIVLATPVGTFIDIAKRIKPKADAVVIDLGSVKGGLVLEIEDLLKGKAYYVGCHPIAGGHHSGFRYAKGDLFNNALCIITPTPNTDKRVLKQIEDMWSSLGAKTMHLDPFKHDEIYSLVSHFPHLLSYALLMTVYKEDPKSIEFSGKGFRDMVRIAGSPAQIWKDIVFYNKENLLQNITALKTEIEYLEDCLKQNKSDEIYQYFRSSQEIYQRLFNPT
ncbi:MAG: prephenate dehydrogenase [Thermodesulfovibrionales bacterium]|nr:prephenate dehydrogenase [Thermodesulfovibrionales bacterium]